jgi:hypothetical protein
MLKRIFLAAVIIGTLIALLVPATALAFNPQPEPPALVNKLESMVNVLEGTNMDLERISSMPTPALGGQVGRLEAMANQLQVLDEQLGLLDGEALVGMEPLDIPPTVEAFQDVKTSAQKVFNSAAELIGMEPLDMPVENVQQGAIDIMDKVDDYISLLVPGT